MFLHVVPCSHSEAAPYCRSGRYELPPGFSQRMRISGRHYGAGPADDQRGIPDVSYDARRSARHGFTDYEGKGFTAEGSSGGDIHRGKEARHILANSQEMTAVTYARGLDPLHQLRILQGDAKAAQQEVNLWYLFVQSRGRPNEVEMILLRMKAGCYSN
jgi:hypothetical protein